MAAIVRQQGREVIRMMVCLTFLARGPARRRPPFPPSCTTRLDIPSCPVWQTPSSSSMVAWSLAGFFHPLLPKPISNPNHGAYLVLQPSQMGCCFPI